MELRKRNKPTAALVQQREALISRATKRQRSGPATLPTITLKIPAAAASVNDENDDDEPESDADPDDEDAAGARKRTHLRGRRSRTDRGLTFLQTARERNIPVRSGKWNEAEELYLRKLVQLFNNGLLEVNDARLSMRVWLSKMLSCCPMRISKKQSHGEKFKGKAKYLRNKDRVANMSQKEFAEHWHEVRTLRANFLHHWARDEFVRWCTSSHVEYFGEWYRNIIEQLPTPELAMNAKHVAPTDTIEMPPWESIKHEADVTVAAKKAQSKASQTSHEDDDSESEEEDQVDEEEGQDEEDSSCPPSPGSALDDRPLCQESCCTITEADMALLANEELSEPSQLYEMELAVDSWSTYQDHWELCEEAPLKPGNNASSSGVKSTIVLDFGPPSQWNGEASTVTKDVASSPGTSTWVDELLGDESLLAFDPTHLLLTDVSVELPTDAWFQQLSAPLQL